MQIAQALEEAHEKGIVHRDLKPQNVKASIEGKVKVLDFGLAKAMDPGAGSASAADLARSPTLLNSPTLTAVQGTQLGVILGTAAYMAPEQARGVAVDKRADIWAFGVVLYEMLTGRRLFEGELVTDVLANVLKSDVDLDSLPAETPSAIRRLVRRCLERNPKNRLHDIADARIVLEELLAGREEERQVPVVAARRGWMAVALGLAVAFAVGLAVGRWAFVRAGTEPGGSPISFERLTFRPGHFANARFAPDGQTVFLSADWESNRRQIYQVRPKSGELAIGLPGAELLSVSRSGELALLLPRVESGNAYVQWGTLAVASASGGTPRELAEGVQAADWATDGGSLAVLKLGEGRQHLEFPLGTLLYEPPQRITSPRVSPAGDAVAFFEDEPDGTLSVVVVERSGRRQVLSAGWFDWWLLAWSPDGREVWFSAAHAGAAASLYAVDRGGKLRTLLSAPGTLELHDVAPDGDALVAQVDARFHVFGRRSGDPSERDLSWLEQTTATDLSADGESILLSSQSERDLGHTSVSLRAMDGAPPVRLGDGDPQELSRDGKWALAIRAGSVVALPTAAGKERVLETSLQSISLARWMPDGVHVLLVAKDRDGRSVLSVANFDGGPERIVVAPFALRSGSARNRPLSPVSPDGRFVAAAIATGGIVVLSLADGEARPLPGSGPNDLPTQWTADGRELFVFDPSRLPARISKVDLASGRQTLWREVEPVDRTGVAGVVKALVTPDGSAYAYSYLQFRSDLYLVKGLQ